MLRDLWGLRLAALPGGPGRPGPGRTVRVLCVCVCARACMRACACTCVRACACACVRACACLCVRAWGLCVCVCSLAQGVRHFEGKGPKPRDSAASPEKCTAGT